MLTLPLPRIALRNVMRNRRRSLLTIAAVFVALAMLVSIRGFLDGLQASLRESVVLGQTGALQVHRRGFRRSVDTSALDLALPADDAFLARITAVDGVTAAAPRITFPAMANAEDTSTPAVFAAIDPRRELAVCPQRLEAISDSATLDAGAILTPELGTRLGLPLGGRLTLLATDADGVLGAADVDFVGRYGQPGLPLPDKKLGFVPLRVAQDLLRMPGRATEIVVGTRRLDDAPAVAARLSAALGPEFEVTTWHDVAGFVDEATKAQNVILRLVAAAFLFVALLGIANTTLMSVLERTREIGTMMSLGVRRRQILRLLLAEAALLGLFGGVAGSAAGAAIVGHFHRTGLALRLPDMAAPLHIYPTVGARYLIVAIALGVAGAIVAALWPSLRGCRLSPVAALGAV